VRERPSGALDVRHLRLMDRVLSDRTVVFV